MKINTATDTLAVPAVRRLAAAVAGGILLVALSTSIAGAGVVFQTGFEPPDYALGNLDGQQGWSTPVGPVDRVRVRNDVPRVGAHSLWAASGGGGVPDTGAFRSLSKDMTGSTLSLSSRVIFTTGQRSDWEFSSVFGTAGFIGGLRVMGNDEFVLETSLGSTATGVFIGGFQTIELFFDFSTGLAAAFRNGAEMVSGVAFDNTNAQLTEIAALRLITPRADAVALDEFVVMPEPGGLAVLGLGLAALAGLRRRRLGR